MSDRPYEYLSIAVQGHPDRVMNAHGAQGWETFAVTRGGYDGLGRLRNDATLFLYLRRPRAPLPPEPEPIRQARVLRPPRPHKRPDGAMPVSEAALRRPAAGAPERGR